MPQGDPPLPREPRDPSPNPSIVDLAPVGEAPRNRVLAGRIGPAQVDVVPHEHQVARIQVIGHRAGGAGQQEAFHSQLHEQVHGAERVRQAVATLKPDRRWTLLLREVEEMSYEEIAAMTGVPVGTVRSRLARARDDLRRALTGTM